jgi:ribosomal protein L7Ae-like RNA K-turn-binding protein
MQAQERSRAKRPLKVFVDSPFDAAKEIVPELSKEDCDVVVAWLVAARARKGCLLFGTNEVVRRVKELTVVFVVSVDAASVLTQHVREACVLAECRVAALPLTSDALGKTLGMKRALVVGVKKEDTSSKDLDKFGAVPHLPWLESVKRAKFAPLKSGLTRSKAPDDVFDKRAERKAKLNEKMKALKLKRDADKKIVRSNDKAKRQKITPKAPTSGHNNNSGKR